MTHFRQIFDPRTFAFTYLLGDDSGAAVVIDAGSERTTLPVLAMLAELNLRLDYLLQTHVHDDEPNDAAALKERTGARVVASETARAGADIPVRHGDTITFGNEVIHVLGTPGHTPACLSYLWRDRVFTGDALLIRSLRSIGPTGRRCRRAIRQHHAAPVRAAGRHARLSGPRRPRTHRLDDRRGARAQSCVAGRSRDEFITQRING